MTGSGTPRMNPEFLRRVRIFEALEVPELAEILMLGVVKEYAKEDVIFEDGAPGDSFYVIYDGAVRISKMFPHMGEEALTILGAGEFFGEMSFVDDDPRSARAVAHEGAKLLELKNADLKSHLATRPEVALKFLWAFSRTLSQRVRDTNAKFSTLFTISRVF
ncbi:MAG TPA: cyclic nucleotide-binding domain-containing protein [Vicinamibacteria bacterium]|nr:cyclic nucleotide-binding domain-containing protein [Vicinamibacteria bacterium]